MPDCNIHVYIFRYTEHKDLHSSITINPSNEKRAIITEWKNYKKRNRHIGRIHDHISAIYNVLGKNILYF